LIELFVCSRSFDGCFVTRNADDVERKRKRMAIMIGVIAAGNPFVYVSVSSQVDYFVVGAAIFVLAFLMVAIGLRMSAYIDNMRKSDANFLSLSVLIKDTT
jgi:hypothetical protein